MSAIKHQLFTRYFQQFWTVAIISNTQFSG